MKSYVNYPLNFEKMLLADTIASSSGKLFADYALYKKVSHLQGTVVKCGINSEEDFAKFAMFQEFVSKHSAQKVVAFEKSLDSNKYSNSITKDGTLVYQINKTLVNQQKVQKQVLEKTAPSINFISGNIDDSIPEYLMENPECKIAYLSINLDDYHASINVLDFFYPRLVIGGILVFDNYSKKGEDYQAFKDYFRSNPVEINSFSVNKGPHFTIRH